MKLVDEDGRIPAPVIGALIGGGVAGIAAIIKGKSATEVLSATVGGAVDGVIFAAGGFLMRKVISNTIVVNSISGGIGGGVGDLVEQGLNIAFSNRDRLDGSDIAISAVLGASSNGASESIEQKGKSLIKEVIDSDTTQKALEKEVKQSVKSAGRKTTPSSVKKAVDDKIKEMTEAADKTLETSLQALGYSFGFYNYVLTNE